MESNERIKDDPSIADLKQPLERVHNFRDVGATVNAFLGKRVLREGYLFRSGRLDESTPEDRRKLIQDYGVRTVLDLRTNTERRVRLQRKISGENGIAAKDSGTGGTDYNDITLLGATTHNVYIIGKNLERALVGMLSWWSMFLVIAYMLLGYRLSAIHIISREVIEKAGLSGMAKMSLEHSGEDIKKAFQILTVPSSSSFSYPILIHCTQGKDRTGLLILLILLCLPSPSIPIDAITHDYTLSSTGLLPVRAEIIREITADGGLPASFADVDLDFVSDVSAYLTRRWGGIGGYLASLGLDAEKVVGAVRVALLVE